MTRNRPAQRVASYDNYTGISFAFGAVPAHGHASYLLLILPVPAIPLAPTAKPTPSKEVSNTDT
jgi:hypothetical protein